MRTSLLRGTVFKSSGELRVIATVMFLFSLTGFVAQLFMLWLFYSLAYMEGGGTVAVAHRTIALYLDDQQKHWFLQSRAVASLDIAWGLGAPVAEMFAAASLFLFKPWARSLLRGIIIVRLLLTVMLAIAATGAAFLSYINIVYTLLSVLAIVALRPKRSGNRVSDVVF